MQQLNLRKKEVESNFLKFKIYYALNLHLPFKNLSADAIIREHPNRIKQISGQAEHRIKK